MNMNEADYLVKPHLNMDDLMLLPQPASALAARFGCTCTSRVGHTGVRPLDEHCDGVIYRMPFDCPVHAHDPAISGDNPTMLCFRDSELGRKLQADEEYKKEHTHAADRI